LFPVLCNIASGTILSELSVSRVKFKSDGERLFFLMSKNIKNTLLRCRETSRVLIPPDTCRRSPALLRRGNFPAGAFEGSPRTRCAMWEAFECLVDGGNFRLLWIV
jgi:hypothetical protein